MNPTALNQELFECMVQQHSLILTDKTADSKQQGRPVQGFKRSAYGLSYSYGITGYKCRFKSIDPESPIPLN